MDEEFWANEARQLLAVLLPPLTEMAQEGARLAIGFNNELANEAVRSGNWLDDEGFSTAD